MSEPSPGRAPLDAQAVCQALGLRPSYLAQVLVREVAYQHQELAKQAMSEGPELGGFALQHLSNLLHLISELMAAEAQALTSEDRVTRREAWARDRRESWALGGEGGGGAKEATLAATPTPLNPSEPPPGPARWGSD